MDLQLSERSRYHDFESHPKTLNQRGKCLEMSWKHSSDVYLEKVGWNKKTWWTSAESTSRPMNFQSNTSAKMLSATQICFRFVRLREALSFLPALSWIHIIYRQYRPELVDFLKSWLMLYWWRSSFFFNVHPWKANDAETPHELAHKPWLNETTKPHWGVFVINFRETATGSVVFPIKVYRHFIREKGDCRVTCRDSLCGDLLFETTNSWKKKGKRQFRTGESTGLLARVEKCIPWKFVNLLSHSR